MTIANPTHHYMQLLANVPPELLTPGVYRVNVYHDDWCGVYSGQMCNCKPEIQITKVATGEVVYQSEWR